jgi:hypothetical protein
MINFMIATKKHGNCFEYFKEKVPKLSDVKLKVGIFIGLKISEIINGDLFEYLLTETEKSAWLKFKAVYLKSAWKCSNRNLQGTC